MPRLSPIDPGEKDRAILIQQRTVAHSGTSRFPVETWSTLAARVYAAKYDNGGREEMRSGEMSSRGDVRWEIGYRSDMDPELVTVTADRRLVYQSRTYDIVAANMIGRRDGIELWTVAKVG